MSEKIKRLVLSALTISALLLGAPILAQEATSEAPLLDEAPAADPVDVEVTADDDVILDDTTTPVTEPDVPLSLFMEGALTLVIVAILKRFKALENVPAPSITVLVAFILWGIFQWARARGFAAQFNEISDHLVILLPAITEILLSLFGATAGFLVMRAARFPLLGYSRT